MFEAADPESLLETLTPGRVVFAALTILAAWAAIRAIRDGLSFLGNSVPRADIFFKRLQPFITIGIWFIAAFVILSMLAPTRETFLAGIGSIAIALGLGAQDLIKNVLGGIIVLTDRPFQLKDRVRIGDAYGEIDHIGLRSIKLITPEGDRVTVPNADILTSQVFNANSGDLACKVVTDVFLPFHVDTDEAQRVGREAAFASPYVLVSKPVIVVISDQFQDSPYVQVRIKAYVHDHHFEHEMQSDITVRAKQEFARRGMLSFDP